MAQPGSEGGSSQFGVEEDLALLMAVESSVGVINMLDPTDNDLTGCDDLLTPSFSPGGQQSPLKLRAWPTPQSTPIMAGPNQTPAPTMMLSPSLMVWSPEQHEALLGAMGELAGGNSDWIGVADKVRGKSEKECRDRWNYHLRSNKWTHSEHQRLVEAHAQHQGVWERIQPLFPDQPLALLKAYWATYAKASPLLMGRPSTKPGGKSLPPSPIAGLPAASQQRQSPVRTSPRTVSREQRALASPFLVQSGRNSRLGPLSSMDSPFGAPQTPGGSSRLSLPYTPGTASSLKSAHEALSLAAAEEEDGMLDAEAAAASAAQLLGEQHSLPCTPLGSMHHVRVKVRRGTALPGRYKEEDVLLDGAWGDQVTPQTPYGARTNRSKRGYYDNEGYEGYEEDDFDQEEQDDGYDDPEGSPYRPGHNQSRKRRADQRQPGGGGGVRTNKNSTVLPGARVKKLTPKAQAARESHHYGDDVPYGERQERESHAASRERASQKLDKCESKMVQAMKAAAIEAVASGNFKGDLVMSAKNDSGYEGVDFHQGKWRARIRTGTSRIVLGRFDTKVEAGQAYAAAFREVPEGLGSKVPSNGGQRVVGDREEEVMMVSRPKQASTPKRVGERSKKPRRF